MSGKNHKQKINLQGENHYRKLIRKQKFSSVLLRQRRRYICGHLPPARANGTKREAVWYSELYLFEKGGKNDFMEVMNYVIFSLSHGKI